MPTLSALPPGLRHVAGVYHQLALAALPTLTWSHLTWYGGIVAFTAFLRHFALSVEAPVPEHVMTCLTSLMSGSAPMSGVTNVLAMLGGVDTLNAGVMLAAAMPAVVPKLRGGLLSQYCAHLLRCACSCTAAGDVVTIAAAVTAMTDAIGGVASALHAQWSWSANHRGKVLPRYATAPEVPLLLLHVVSCWATAVVIPTSSHPLPRPTPPSPHFEELQRGTCPRRRAAVCAHAARAMMQWVPQLLFSSIPGEWRVFASSALVASLCPIDGNSHALVADVVQCDMDSVIALVAASLRCLDVARIDTHLAAVAAVVHGLWAVDAWCSVNGVCLPTGRWTGLCQVAAVRIATTALTVFPPPASVAGVHALESPSTTAFRDALKAVIVTGMRSENPDVASTAFLAMAGVQ
jgi:hypothetical protein